MEDKLLSILAELCDEEQVKDDLDMELIDSALLDSLAYAELLFLIEDEFGVIISPSDVGRDDMDTPRKIINLVKSRME
ncbi:D-alanine--poly(phosphoribitol) ligase subunit 2 [Allofustis seminis]|uniref:D-alanine--poly(phosphoribitol) ligase subunit 2 n=1 Tax=Allofustis seminis TaxID=166939 RepID=UPI00037F4196|nr:D-alanine--poly(phosphoribitol) ligase subunit 2 [Allofustis seminis]